jgi:hypothetical protein
VSANLLRQQILALREVDWLLFDGANLLPLRYIAPPVGLAMSPPLPNARLIQAGEARMRQQDM